jgi:hypothetical protein
MVFPSILGVIGLGLAVGGTIFNLVQQSKAADLQEEAAAAQRRSLELQQKKNKLEVRRQKIQLIRETRIKRASAVSRAEAQTGGFGGSIQGGVGSIISQGSSGLGFLNQANSFTIAARKELAQSTIFNNQAVQLRNQGAIGQGIASIGGTIFNRREDLYKLGTQLGVFG